MELENTNEYLVDWFVQTAYGFVIGNDIIQHKVNKEVSMYRQGQLVHLMGEFLVRGNSNIVCKRQEFFEPISVKDFGEALELKEDALRNFMKDMAKLDRIKVINNCIYVNPSFIISFEMDYIRQELINMFPNSKSEIDIINQYLRGEHGTREQ